MNIKCMLAISFSYSRHMRAGSQSSPSPSHPHTDRTRSVYSFDGLEGGAQAEQNSRIK